MEQLGDRLEEEVSLDARVGPFGPDPRDEVVQLGQQQHEDPTIASDPGRCLGRHGAQRGPQRLDHRLERHDGVLRRPPPQDDAAHVVHVRREPRRQPGLAGTGFTGEECQVPVTADGFRPQAMQRAEMGLAADERRPPSPHNRTR